MRMIDVVEQISQSGGEWQSMPPVIFEGCEDYKKGMSEEEIQAILEGLSTQQWQEILTNKEITTELDLEIFQALYHFEGHNAPASQIGSILGHTHSYLNLEIGRYAKRIAEHYDIHFKERSNRKYKYWDLFFDGWSDGRYFVWRLRPNLVEALEECKLTGEDQATDEITVEETHKIAEGMKKMIFVNSYERNPKARRLCISHFGVTCTVCGIDLEKMYGEIARGFIHVHHLTPISQIGKSYQVDPVLDLRPVCPNCHAILHRSNPPLTIEQLKNILQKNNCSKVT
jgi:5-methylcytosine-specific restriction enzyme A